MSQGRKLVVDSAEIYRLAFLGQSNRQIAAGIPCHHSAFTRRPDILAVLESGRRARATALDAQWRLDALAGLRSTWDEADTAASVRQIRAAEQRSIERRRPS